ncbi:DUF4097 family beta strand repeat-containing protein [Cerasibacillus sp. JNUCC 74]
MGNIKKLSLIALLLITIGGTGSLFTFKTLERGTVSETKEVEAKEISNLKIDLINEKVNIVPTKEAEIKIELKGKSNEPDRKHLNIDKQGGTLTIQKKREHFKKFVFFERSDSLTLTVHLPKKEYESIQVEVNNGSIKADHITVKNMKVSGDNGKIFLRDVKTDQTNVGTTNGSVLLKDISGKLKGKTNNGKISLLTVDLDRSLDFTTNNGTIEIKTENEPTNVTYDLRVGNGNIQVFDEKNWDTVIGNGKNLIKASTDNGDIEIKKY